MTDQSCGHDTVVTIAAQFDGRTDEPGTGEIRGSGIKLGGTAVLGDPAAEQQGNGMGDVFADANLSPAKLALRKS